jgi:phosphosulfolactate synthase
MTNQHVHDPQRAGSLSADRPTFLTLPSRTSKPRTTGVSHVLDNGLSLGEVEHRLSAAAGAIDLWKFGWGTAYVDSAVRAKVELLSQHGVMACTGGTLLEVAWCQGAAAEFFDWAEAVGFPAIEVSNGTVSMTREVKETLISRAASRFVVLAEVGRKAPTALLTADEWSRDAQADLRAGARWVVTEGRESGTVGLFTKEGEVRTDIVDAIVSGIGLERALFEAPQRAQQAWLIRRYGPNVNLGNINASDALSLETLRLGLRSDTLDAPFTHRATTEVDQ